MKSLKSLHPYFVKYKWHLLGGLLFVSLSTLLRSYQGIVIRNGTDEVLKLIGEQEKSNNMQFVKLGAQMIGLALLSGFFMFLMRQTIIVMSRHIEYDQKNELFAHYQSMDSSFYKQNRIGDLMNRIGEDVSKVRMYTGPAIMYLANTTVTVIMVLGFMFHVNISLSLLVFMPLPILALLIYKISDLINKKSHQVQEQLSAITSFTQESFSGIRTIKAYARESYYSKEMEKESELYKKKALSLAKTEAMFAPSMLLMISLSILFTVWYGGKLAIDGKISGGNITEFIYYLFQLTWPFASLGWVISLIQRASASQQRIDEFLQTKSKIQSINTEQYTINGEIEFRNVSFVYPENNVKALKNINLKVIPGQKLGITGGVGSGKSTLLNLITRQYDATNGEILIDGKDIKQHNLTVLRKFIGVVPQETVLFSDSIKNNILFGIGEEKVSREKIAHYTKLVGIHEEIEKFPEQYETQIGERGISLSGGQKQRISIARALMHKPDILLLDDCLSAVDSETEQHILDEFEKELKEKTLFIVSHRISAIKNCDIIIYLENGEIAEKGTHEELINMGGRYFTLHKIQSS